MLRKFRSKRGDSEFDFLLYLIIAVIILVIFFILYAFFKIRGISILEVIKNKILGLGW